MMLSRNAIIIATLAGDSVAPPVGAFVAKLGYRPDTNSKVKPLQKSLYTFPLLFLPL